MRYVFNTLAAIAELIQGRKENSFRHAVSLPFAIPAALMIFAGYYPHD